MSVAALIVDDDRELHEQVRAILEAEIRADVTSALVSVDARHLLEGSLFDLILLRTDMPDLNGLRIAEALRRSQGPSCAALVIGLSGETTDGHVHRCLNNGMTTVIERPVVKHQLVAALRNLGLAPSPAPASTAASIATFDALANGLRIELIRVLARGGPASATTLARQMTMSRQKLAFHLNVLQQARLVAIHRQGRETLFAARTDDLGALAQWTIQFADRPDGSLP